MILLNRLITVVLPLTVLGSFVFAARVPERQMTIIVFEMAIVLLCMFSLTNLRLREATSWLFSGMILLFVGSSFFFFLFLDFSWMRTVFMIVTTALAWLATELIFRFLYMRSRYQPHALEHLIGYLHILVTFYMTSGLIALTYFSAISQHVILVIFTGVMFLLLVIHSQMIHVPKRKTWLFVIVALWLLVGWFWVMHYLPVSNHVIGLSVAVVFYVFVNLSQKSFHASLDKAAVKRYLIIGATVLLIAFLSAEWI